MSRFDVRSEAVHYREQGAGSLEEGAGSLGCPTAWAACPQVSCLPSQPRRVPSRQGLHPLTAGSSGCPTAALAPGCPRDTAGRDTWGPVQEGHAALTPRRALSPGMIHQNTAAGRIQPAEGGLGAVQTNFPGGAGPDPPPRPGTAPEPGAAPAGGRARGCGAAGLRRVPGSEGARLRRVPGSEGPCQRGSLLSPPQESHRGKAELRRCWELGAVGREKLG